MTRRPRSTTARIRRGVQLAFLTLFLALVLWARPYPGADPSAWLGLFFLLDPLLLLATALAAHAVPLACLASLGLILLTMLLGRVFCGWACPLGTLHDLAGRLFDLLQGRAKRAERWSRWQLAKYFLLVGFLAMAVFGGHWVTLFDPLVLLYRTTTVSLLPALQWAVETGSTFVFQADPKLGPLRLTSLSEPVYGFFRDHVFVVQKQSFLGSLGIAAVLVAMLLANAYRRRFWCRYLCPLGALLGVFSWRPLLRRTVDPARCNQCELCGMACHGAAAQAPGEGWKSAECLGCFNCTASCHRAGLGFHWVWPGRPKKPEEQLGVSRRAALASAVGGVTGLALVRAWPQGRGSVYHPALIRPPGARPELDFLARCTACGMCMKICPTGGLQPCWTEAGLEGLWTPRLVPRIGYCDYMCTRCGHVCPTGAIQPLSVDAKHQIRIGLASFDITRCIPYAYGRDCMVCEEHCPIPDKAIYFVEVEQRGRDGSVRTIKQPHVDPEKCIGCGVCEAVCPLKDRPGVRVFSANETRHPGNQPILPAWDGAPY